MEELGTDKRRRRVGGGSKWWSEGKTSLSRQSTWENDGSEDAGWLEGSDAMRNGLYSGEIRSGPLDEDGLGLVGMCKVEGRGTGPKLGSRNQKGPLVSSGPISGVCWCKLRANGGRPVVRDSVGQKTWHVSLPLCGTISHPDGFQARPGQKTWQFF